jgi:hypothetical protein
MTVLFITLNPKTNYLQNARAHPAFLPKRDPARGLLRSGRRSLTHGGLCWLRAKAGSNSVPTPCARTVDQIDGTAGALPEGVVAEIEALIDREPEVAPDKAR